MDEVRELPFTVLFSKPRRNLDGGQSIIIKDELTATNPILTLKTVRWDKDSNSVIFQTPVSDRHTFEAMDKLVMETAVEHQIQWFGRTLPINKIKSMFCTSLEPTGTLRVKAPSNVQAYDILCQTTNPTSLEGRSVDVKLAVVGVYFKPGRFGVSYKVRQVKLLPTYGLLHYAFEDDSQDDFSDADSN